MNDVPKIIWQTHNYELKDLPDNLKKIKQTWEMVNPNWEYRYVSHIEREEVIKQYPVFWKYYHLTNPICQADIWRYIVTYEYGGVYADMDSVCVKPIDYMLESIEDYEMAVVPKFLWKNYHPFISLNNTNLTNFPVNALQRFDGYGTNNANYVVTKQSKIMKQIIEKSEEHLVKMFENKINNISLLSPFLDVVIDSNNVSYEFDVAIHGDIYKNGFDPDFAIDDYGTLIHYNDYLQKYNIVELESKL